MRLDRLYLALLVIAPATAFPQQNALASRVTAALAIPFQVDTLRLRGVPEDQVRIVIDEARRRKLPASETHDILGEANRDVRDHGPVNNFGAFVQSQLASGKRGRALAAAIRAEHQRRGVGKGKTLASGSRAGRTDSVHRSSTANRAKAAPARAQASTKGSATKSNSAKANAAKTTKAGATKSTTTKSNATKANATKKPIVRDDKRGRP